MNMITREGNRSDSLALEALAGMAMEKVETSRPKPPAWMIAPNFRRDEPLALREPRAVYRAGAGEEIGPYRSVREVPRFS